MSNKVVYKYDQENRLISHIVPNIGWGCLYVYKNNLRKIYYYHQKVNTYQISKQVLIGEIYQNVSALTTFNKSVVYQKFNEGKLIYSRVLTKNKTLFEVNVMVDTGTSKMEKITFTDKKGKKQQTIQFKTRQDGK